MAAQSATGFVRRRSAATTVLVLFAMAAPPANHATAATPPCLNPSDSLVHEMALRLESARGGVIVHRSGHTNPATFKTAAPSGYEVTLRPAWTRLDSVQAMGFVRLLDLERRPPRANVYTPPCPRTEGRWDDVTLSFPLGPDTVVAAITPASGEARFTWRGCSSQTILGDRATAFMNAAMQALPADSALRSTRACTQAASDSTAVPVGGFVETFPRATRHADLEYPVDAGRAGVEGTVIVKALVGRDGRVRMTAVTTSVPMLDEAAIRNVETWQFEPATSGGKPVAVWVSIPVRFKLH